MAGRGERRVGKTWEMTGGNEGDDDDEDGSGGGDSWQAQSSYSVASTVLIIACYQFP